MRTNPTDDQGEPARSQPDRKPYPSWDEMVSRIRRDRVDTSRAPDPAHLDREWRDLVADLIVGR